MDHVVPAGITVVEAEPTVLTTLGGSEWLLEEAEAPPVFASANPLVLLDPPPHRVSERKVTEMEPGMLVNDAGIWDQFLIKPSAVEGLVGGASILAMEAGLL